MNRSSKVFFLILTGAVLLVPPAFAEDTATGTRLLSGLNKDNTGKALDGSWDAAIVTATDVSGSDTTGQLVNQWGKAGEANAAEVRTQMEDKQKLVKEAQKKLGQKGQEGMTLRRATNNAQLIKKGDALLKEGDKVIENTKGAGTWCNKIGKVLDVINVVAVGAKAAGYAAEGDMNGASGAIVDETTKRITTAGGGLIGTFGGGHVGAILGAAGAEALHDATTKMIIEKNVSIARNNDAKNKMQGTGAAPVVIMNESGGTRTLASDQYVESGTGVIKQRNDEQQQSYRNQISQEIRTRPAGAALGPLDIALGKLMRGEISQADYDRQIEALNDPNRIPPVDEDETEEGRKGDQGKGDEGQAIEEADPVDPAAVNEAKDIIPARVTATVAFNEDYSHEEYRNTVHSVVTLTFWNVGSLQPDRGGVAVSMTNTASINGSTDTVKGSGTFTGGPNGKFHLTVGGRSVRGKLTGGHTVSYGKYQGNVENPAAFTPWIK